MSIRRLTPKEKRRVQRVLEGRADLENLTTPEELHQFAWNYNWDDDPLEELLWVIRQPFCDKGTALLIYWRAAPAWYYSEYADRSEIIIPQDSNSYSKYQANLAKRELQHYDFIKEIEEKFKTGFYKHQSIRFDPTNDQMTNWTKVYNDLPRKQPIPPEMTKATPGEPAEREAF